MNAANAKITSFFTSTSSNGNCSVKMPCKYEYSEGSTNKQNQPLQESIWNKIILLQRNLKKIIPSYIIANSYKRDIYY